MQNHFSSLAIPTWGLLSSLAKDLKWFEQFLLPAMLSDKSKKPDGVLCWGLKASARRAEIFANRRGIPLIRMEDAFLRSVKFGPKERPLGMVMDDLGIYYDCSRPSRLEQMILQPLSESEMQRARETVRLWRAGRVSKYNHAREYEGHLPADYILAVDQTAGDLSLKHGGADAKKFELMLEAALRENPGSQILLKTHPEVLAGRKKGHFDLSRLKSEPRLILLGEDVHPVRLLEEAKAVYVVTSQMGFEALLWGKPVRTFGSPFYAGWGLTQDELPQPSRRRAATFEQLVHAALIAYARYVHPETKKRCEVEDIISHLALQRRQISRWPKKIGAIQISRWKRQHVKRFFPYSDVRFFKKPNNLSGEAAPAVWSIRNNGATKKTNPIRLEDGFIRSVASGSDLIPPLSWVADRSGIYFDPTQPSDLEKILQNEIFTQDIVIRAAEIRGRIVQQGVTKYNFGTEQWMRPDFPVVNKQVVLVPGQVESDASIQFGSPVIRTNFDLLSAVRDERPRAFILYKPHPEIVAGRQSCGPRESECAKIADQVLTHQTMGRLLEDVDEVHTMTSLAGFEALMRGKKVTVYGQPFYSGWGLTEDKSPHPRRTRTLSLDELVAGAIILYPLYISAVTGRYTTPERVLDELADWQNLPLPKASLLAKVYRKIMDMARPHNPFQ